MYNDLLSNLSSLSALQTWNVNNLSRRKEKEQLASLKQHHQEEIDHHKKEIDRLQQEIKRHEGKIKELKG